MEVVVHELLQAPGEPVRRAYRAPGSGPQQVRRRAADRDHRHRRQQCLRHEQSDRRGEDPKERRYQGDDGMEMVPEQVDARAPDVDDGRAQVGVLLDVLGEDPQVPGRRVEPEIAEHRDRDVHSEDGEGNEPRDPVGPLCLPG